MWENVSILQLSLLGACTCMGLLLQEYIDEHFEVIQYMYYVYIIPRKYSQESYDPQLDIALVHGCFNVIIRVNEATDHISETKHVKLTFHS